MSSYYYILVRTRGGTTSSSGINIISRCHRYNCEQAVISEELVRYDNAALSYLDTALRAMFYCKYVYAHAANSNIR